MSVEFQPIRTEPAYRKVAGALLERILDRTLQDGDRLPTESELARQFGVNRSTVREALRELESNGLLGRRPGTKRMVITRPQAGPISARVSRALLLQGVTFMDVWEALSILEPPLAETAARRRQILDIENIREAVHRFAAANADAVFAVRHTAAFFRRLGEATHNPALQLAQEPLLQPLEPSLGAMIDRVPQARERIVTAQRKLCEAVEARDANSARTWMERHVRDFRRGYELAGIRLEHHVTDIPAAVV